MQGWLKKYGIIIWAIYVGYLKIIDMFYFKMDIKFMYCRFKNVIKIKIVQYYDDNFFES